MFVCEHCNSKIVGTVFGIGQDSTGYCGVCKEHVNCYEIEDETEVLGVVLDPNELGL